MDANTIMTIMTFENFEKILLVVMAIFTLSYSILVTRDLYDLQGHYESRLENPFRLLALGIILIAVILFIFSIW